MSPTTTRQKVGFVLAGLLSAANIPGVFFPTPEGQEGPPMAILIASAILGVIGLVAVIIAWRSGNRAAVRVAAGAIIVNLLTTLPAFFVDVSAGIKLLSGVAVLLSVLAVAMMFSPSRQPAPALD